MTCHHSEFDAEELYFDLSHVRQRNSLLHNVLNESNKTSISALRIVEYLTWASPPCSSICIIRIWSALQWAPQKRSWMTYYTQHFLVLVDTMDLNDPKSHWTQIFPIASPGQSCQHIVAPGRRAWLTYRHQAPAAPSMRQTQLFHAAQMATSVCPTISAHIHLIAMPVEADTILLGVQMGQLWTKAQARHAQIDVVSEIKKISLSYYCSLVRCI